MDQVFLDTAGLAALVNRDDGLHERAVSVIGELHAEGVSSVTTDWVLAELLSIAARRRLRRPAEALVLEVLSNSEVQVLPATRRSWLEAFSLWRERADKEWSLVDCASILVCRSRRIRRVFTHDRHFTQAGLEAILS